MRSTTGLSWRRENSPTLVLVCRRQRTRSGRQSEAPLRRLHAAAKNLGFQSAGRFGDRRHNLTLADARKGGVARWAAEHERRAELEQRAVELLADELLRAIEVWIEVMRDEEPPPSAR